MSNKQNLTAAEKAYNRSLFYKRYGIALVMVAMIVILSLTTKKFLTATNILNVINTISINGCIALGMVFVITAGGIDLTVGSMLAWGSVIIGTILEHFGTVSSIPIACIASIVSCAAMGLVNGFLISYFNIFPFVVTLAMQLVIRGLATALCGGYSFAVPVSEFTQLGLGKLFNTIPYPALMLLAVALIAYFLMHWTRFGRYVYAVGGNVQAATAAGVNVFWTRTVTYILSGVFTSIASIIMTAKINASQPNVGVGYETDAIAACVIGGTSFAGGVATIPGTVMGIIIIGLIYNGMNLLRVESYWQTVCKGILIILAVLIDKMVNKKR